MIFFYAFLSLVGVKFLLNLYRWFSTRWYLSRYERYVLNINYVSSYSIEQRKQNILNLFEMANIQEPYVTHVEELGYGHANASRVSAFRNLTSNRADIVHLVMSGFHQSIGVYRTRSLESFNPIYWLAAIIYLPQNILQYLGTQEQTVFPKFLTILWWIMGSISIFLYNLFKSEIDTYVKDLIMQYLP